eukprot:8688416-Pyramimonas_sp.AAC.1
MASMLAACQWLAWLPWLTACQWLPWLAACHGFHGLLLVNGFHGFHGLLLVNGLHDCRRRRTVRSARVDFVLVAPASERFVGHRGQH